MAVQKFGMNHLKHPFEVNDSTISQYRQVNRTLALFIALCWLSGHMLAQSSLKTVQISFDLYIANLDQNQRCRQQQFRCLHVSNPDNNAKSFFSRDLREETIDMLKILVPLETSARAAPFSLAASAREDFSSRKILLDAPLQEVSQLGVFFSRYCTLFLGLQVFQAGLLWSCG